MFSKELVVEAPAVPAPSSSYVFFYGDYSFDQSGNEEVVNLFINSAALTTDLSDIDFVDILFYRFQYFAMISDKGTSETPIATHTGKDVEQCKMLCARGAAPTCLSFVFDPASSTCALFDKDHRDTLAGITLED